MPWIAIATTNDVDEFVTEENTRTKNVAEARRWPRPLDHEDLSWLAQDYPRGVTLQPAEIDAEGTILQRLPVICPAVSHIFRRLVDVTVVDRPSQPQGTVVQLGHTRHLVVDTDIDIANSFLFDVLVMMPDGEIIPPGRADFARWQPRSYQEVAAAVLCCALTVPAEHLGVWVDEILRRYEAPPELARLLSGHSGNREQVLDTVLTWLG